jgi:phage protein D
MGGAVIADVTVSVNGTVLPEAAWVDLRSVIVQEDLRALSMFTLEFNNWDDSTQRITWSDSLLFAPGNEVQIWLGYGSDLHPVMLGEITSLEPVFGGGQQPLLVVRGYDHRHRLARGRKTRTFVQMKDSAIAAQIAREAGLHPQIDDTKTTLGYVIQSNQSDWEFLRRRASLIGYEIYVRDKALYFRWPRFADPPDSQLSIGKEITEFSPRLSTLNQPSELSVRAWDVMEKRAIVAAQRTLPGFSGRPSKTWMTSQAFGPASVTVLGQPARNLAEASSIARGQFSTQELAFIEGHLATSGRPQLRAGTVVDISGAGRRFSGPYYVTSVTHSMTPDHGYLTTCTVQRSTA